MKIFAKACIFVAIVMLFVSAACAVDNVAFIIDSGLYNSSGVADKVLRYKAEVETQFPVNLIICNEAQFESYKPAQIRSYLIDLYNNRGIKGAVLCGQIAYALWRNYAPGADDKGINSFYYEDLDGTFTDTNADGYDDLHNWGAHVGPEIWVCWMRPPANDQVNQLKAFLDKTHKYYTGQITFNHRALVAAHRDYDGNIRDGFRMVERLQPLYGSNIDIDGEGADIVVASEQVSMLNANRYEIYDPMGHASSTLQQWDSGYVYASAIKALTGGSIMTFIYGCHSAAFNESPSGNLAQAYCFGSSIGQAASGTSWNYGTEGKWYIYEELNRGSYLGKSWMNMEIIKNTPQYMKDRYGQTFDTDRHLWGDSLLGNPFVYSNYNPPSPSSLASIKSLPDGKSALITGVVTTANFGDCVYVEQPDRTCGIKVQVSNAIALNRQAKISGVLATENGERVIKYGEITDLGAASPIKPFVMVGRDLKGRTGVSGTENLGLLVKIAGNVTASGTDWFMLDDGSGLRDGLGKRGVKVICKGITPPTSGFYAVTGISTTESYGGRNYPVVRVRSSSDIKPYP